MRESATMPGRGEATKGKGNKPNRKNYKGKNKRRDRATSSAPAVDKSSYANGMNDVSWYLNFPNLVEATARIPFPNRPGMMLRSEQSMSGTTTKMSIAVPGVLALHWVPSVGYSDGPTSPASIAARELYADVREKFSSELPEDAPDLFMYLVALDEIHAYIAALKRIYGLINLYNGNNFEFPDRVLRALGLTEAGIQDVRSRKTEFWGRINTLVYNANKFCVPGKMHLFARHRYMNTHVFLDELSVMGQAYVFRQSGYHKVDDSGTTGTALNYYSISDVDTLEALLDPVEQMIYALSTWGDAYTIDGHLRRAYEGSVMLGSELLLEGYVVNPICDQEALVQIENSHAIAVHNSTLNITQDPTTNTVLFTPAATSSSPATFWNKPFLNVHSDTPGPLDVVVATRLHSTTRTGAASSPCVCGTEIVRSMKLWTANFINGQDIVLGTALENTATVSSLSALLRSMIALTWFKHAPMQYLYFTGSQIPMLRGDIHNVTSVSTEDLDNLNRVCIYSEFNCFGDK